MRMKKRTKKNLESAKKLMQDYCSKEMHSISQIREHLRKKGYAISKTTLLKWYSNMDIVKREPNVDRQVKTIEQKRHELNKEDSLTFDAFLSTGMLDFLMDFSRELIRCLPKITEKNISNDDKLETMSYILQWNKKFYMLKTTFENREKNPLDYANMKKDVLITVPSTQQEGSRKDYRYKIDLTGKRKQTREQKQKAKEMKEVWIRGQKVKKQIFIERGKDIAKIQKRRQKEGRLAYKYD